MKNKVWKALSWKCSDKAVIIVGENRTILSGVLLSPDRENKLHVKFPNIEYDDVPELEIKVELLMERI